MKRILSPILALAFSSLAFAESLPFPDLSGKWMMCQKGAFADMVLKMEGNQITGEFYHRGRDFKVPIVGVIEGKELKLKMYFRDAAVAKRLWKNIPADLVESLIATGKIYELFVFPIDTNVTTYVSEGVFYTWWLEGYEKKDGKIVLKEIWEAGDPRAAEKRPPRKGYYMVRAE